MNTWTRLFGSSCSLFRQNYQQVSKDKLIRYALLVLTPLLVTSQVFAQTSRLNRYTTTNFSGTFTSIAGSYTNLGTGDDNSYLAGTLPFAFNYDSTNFPSGTNLYITCNGTAGINFSPGGFGNYLGNSSYANMLCPWTMDGYVDGTGAGLYYSGALGTAPNRYVILEWDGFRSYSGGSAGVHSSAQVLLYETSNKIEFIYRDHSTSLTSASFGIGLNGGTTYGYQYLTYANSQSSTPSTDIRFAPPVAIPPAQLSLNPKTLSFGFTTPLQPITMFATAKNTGTATLHIKGITFGGSSDFSKISGPNVGDSLLAGASAQIGISFAPTASGSRTATFFFTTDGRDSGLQTISLNGNGVLPSVQYSITDLFRKVHTRLGTASAPRYVPVVSSGLANLTFSSISFIGLDAASYSISHMPQNPLPPGVTDSIGVVFNPRIEGRPDAQLVINTDANNAPHDTVRMLGVGVLPRLVIMAPPDSNNLLRFDSVAMGDSVCRTVVLSNPGSDTLHLRRQIMASADYDFTMYALAGTDTLILPGSSKLVNVCFRPLKNGNRLATIGIYTDIPKTFTVPQIDTSQFKIQITGIGVPYGMLSFQGSAIDTSIDQKQNCISEHITNAGQADLTLTSASISGLNASAWSWSGVTLPLTLAPGQSRDIQLCYTAPSRGTQTNALVLTGSSAGRPLTQSLTLQGVGLNNCVSSTPVAPGPVTFGTTNKTLVGMTDTATITVQNCGDLAATYQAQLAPSSTGYTLVGTGSANVAAGNSTTYRVAYTPSAIGASTGSLSVTGGPSAMTFNLGGVGAGVVANGTSSSINVDLGDRHDMTVTIQNTGNVDWTPGAPLISGADAADFKNPTNPGTITAGGSGTLTLTFQPSRVGQETAVLTFPNATPSPIGGFSTNISAVGTAQAGVPMVTAKNGYAIGQSYPNPTTGAADVNVTMPQEGFVRIDLIDAHGSLVRSAFSGRMAQGDHTVALDATGLTSGTYFYVLTAGDLRLTRELTIVK